MNTIHLSWNHMQIPEIEWVTSPRNTWCMFGNTQNLQTTICCLVRHLLNGAIGMTTSQSVGMYIK